MSFSEDDQCMHDVRELRFRSRQLVRGLGFLDDRCFKDSMTPAQAHALLELEVEPLNGAMLAEKLRINKSNSSRVLKSLHKHGFVEMKLVEHDQRMQFAHLTPKGIKKAEDIHSIYDRFTISVLNQLTSEEKESLIKSLATYRKAIDSAFSQDEYSVSPITTRHDSGLEVSYNKFLQEFWIKEERALAGGKFSSHYKAKNSFFWVILKGKNIVGGTGIEPLKGTDYLYLSRMHLLPEARNRGFTKRLVLKSINFAQQKGFRGIYAETTRDLTNTRQVLESMNFKQIPDHIGNTGNQECYEVPLLMFL